MPDSSAIDQALMDRLLADTTLRALLPDGVFWDAAGRSLVTGGNSTRFVVVSLIDAHDEPIFGGRAYEDVLYAVKAVVLSTDATSAATVKAAAARIDADLDMGALTIPGYGLMVMRRRERLRVTEVDDIDTSIRWFHRGGHYQVMAAPATA